MKKLVSLLAGLLLTASVTATEINGVEYGNGLILQTGTVFFNTIGDITTHTPEDPVISQGIGQINSIYQNGILIWENGDNGVEYNMIFDNITLAAFDGPNIFGQISYGDILGTFGFYSSPLGTFQATGDFVADSLAITSVSVLNLFGEGHPVFDLTIVGAADDDSNGGQGQLNILGGDAFDVVIQDTLIRSDESFADVTFNYSSDIINTAGYDWSGSVDLKMVTQTVDEPSLAWLFGFGLGMIGLTRPRGFKHMRRTSVEM